MKKALVVFFIICIWQGVFSQDVVINEIMQNPSVVNDGAGEFFELYNNSDSDVDINGWTIKDDGSDSHLIDNGGPLVITAGGYLVLAINGNSAENGGLTVDYVYQGFTLANGDDEVVLLNDSEVEIDRVNYDGGPEFPDPNGKSMELLNPGYDNNVAGNWAEALDTAVYGDGDKGTPGAQNSIYQGGDNTPPMISGLTYNELSDPMTDVIVTFTVSDNEDNEDYYEFYYRIDSGDWVMITNNITTAEIQCTIPGQADGAAGEFYIKAFDTDDAYSETTVYTLGWGTVDPVSIYDIQFTEDAGGDSPYNGQTVTIENAIVTAVFGTSYFLQQDAQADFWEGIYVYDNSDWVQLYDVVSITGDVGEYFNRTNIESVTMRTNHGPFAGEVVPMQLLTGDIGGVTGLNGESIEGVYVYVADATVTDPDLGYGEWEVDDFVDSSGPCIIDNLGDYTYEPFVDDVFSYMYGVIEYSYGSYKLAVRSDDDLVVIQAPVIGDVTINPEIPHNMNEVDVTAFITDPDDNISSVTLSYFYSQNPVTGVAMVDNGDTTYTGTIPGIAEYNDVYYFITAEDAEGNVTQTDTMMYTVMPEEHIELLIVDGTIEQGDTNSIAIFCSEVLPAWEVSSFQFTIQFDPELIQALDYSTEGLMADGWTIVANFEEPGQVSIAGVNVPDYLQGDYVLIAIDFVAVGLPNQVADIEFTETMFNDGTPASTGVGGSITITGTLPPIELVINEIMYNTPSYDVEWIEIYNPFDSEQNLYGVTISENGASYTFDENLMAPSGYSTILVDSSAETSYVLDFEPTFSILGNGLSLTNSTDFIVLRNMDGSLIDSVEYSDEWGADGNGNTLELNSPELDNNVAENWHESYEEGGTPNAENTQEAPPLFFDDFENGTGNWTLTGTWALTDEESHSPTHALTEDPNWDGGAQGGSGGYTPDQNSTATITQPFNFTDALDANLSFWARVDIELGFDYMYLEVSLNGQDWIELDEYSIEGTEWQLYEYSLGAFAGEHDVYLRFRFFSDGAYESDGMLIDDLTITISDEDNAAPAFLMEGPEFYEGIIDDVELEMHIIDISEITEARLVYFVDDQDSVVIEPDAVSESSYDFTIPEQFAGSMVSYYIYAIDIFGNYGESDMYQYIAGNHMIYDNGIVDFFNNCNAPPTAPHSAAVLITVPDNCISTLTTALIRNYTDINSPNNDMEFHVWEYDTDTGLPGNDLITPFMVTPAATLENTSPMTVIDLREYEAELVGLNQFFVGFNVPAGTVNFTMTDPGTFNHSYLWDGTTWALSPDEDFHFRAVMDDFIEGVTGEFAMSPKAVNNLSQNSPNPFNPTTRFDFTVAESGSEVSLKIYDIRGRLVNTVIANQAYDSGSHSVVWNGMNESGMKAASGIYMFKLDINGESFVRKGVLMK